MVGERSLELFRFLMIEATVVGVDSLFDQLMDSGAQRRPSPSPTCYLFVGNRQAASSPLTRMHDTRVSIQPNDKNNGYLEGLSRTGPKHLHIP